MAVTGFRPPFATHLTRYVYIPMRDGVRLACDIYRPNAPGEFPFLMVRTPYNKNGFGRQEADIYVREGYGLCVTDARGTGGSEGDFTYYNIPAGLGDGADAVNWLAAQPFCNGIVGTFGGSALGAYQILAAREKPEPLKAMFVEVPPVRFYHDNWFVGGIFEAASRVGWLEGMSYNIGVDAPLQQVDGDIDPEGQKIRRQVSLKRLRLRHLRPPEGLSPTPQDWFIGMRTHTDCDGYWDQFDLTPIIRECDIPTTYTAVWYDHFARGTCEAFELHRGPKHLVLTPGEQGTHGPHADLDVHKLRLRWFDHHLKGIENGVMDEPRVKAFVMGAEEWRTFDAWPPAGETVELALSADKALVAPETARPFEDTFVHDPDNPLHGPASIQDIRDCEQGCLTYTTAPLTSGLIVAGKPVLRLFVRSTAEDVHVLVKLCDVFPDGRSRQVSYGRLRASHRHGHERAVSLKPGEPAELTIPLWPTANAFRSGHRIRIAISGSEVPRCEVCPLRSENAVLGTSALRPVVSLPSVPADRA